MRRVTAVLLSVFVFFIFLFTIEVLADQHGNKGEQIPPWMEYVKTGDSSRMLVPKGAKMTKIGDHSIVESLGEYTARRIMELQDVLKENKKEIAESKKQMDDLKKEIELLKQSYDEIKHEMAQQGDL